jgi:hypothetical protein
MAEVKLSSIINIGDFIKCKNDSIYADNSVFKVLDVFRDMYGAVFKVDQYVKTEIIRESYYIGLENFDKNFELIKESQTEKDITEWLK